MNESKPETATHRERSSADLFKDRVTRAVGIAAVGVALLLFIWFSLEILLLLFCGILLAVALDGGTRLIRHQMGLSRGVALGLVVLLAVVPLAVLATIATPTLVTQVQTLADTVPQGFENLRQELARFGWGQDLLSFLDRSRDRILDILAGRAEWLSGVTGIFSQTLDLMTALLVLLLISVYLAAEPELYLRGLLRLFPPQRRQRIQSVLGEAGYVLRWWFVGQGVSMGILGLLMTLGLWLLGVPLAPLVGLFTAIMTFIPNFGPLIAAIPALLLALSVSASTGFYVLILILVIQNIEGSLITPVIHRHTISLPPALIIATQVLLATGVGFIGLLVAMPLVAVTMVLVKRLYVEDVLEQP